MDIAAMVNPMCFPAPALWANRGQGSLNAYYHFAEGNNVGARTVETFSRNFRMAEFWALTIILFAFALLVAELIEKVESKVEFYAGERQ
ncbi:hypothetical protein ACK6D9_04760 [Hoeflea sp. Naph1]|uniref:hypothetical protein n=1 Tax=Hoeflea sp. Naph1 TaxID=3388653 RepID=UPI00398FCB97